MIGGADPGTSGGLAVLDPATRRVWTWALPTTLVPRAGRKPATRLDYPALFSLVSGLAVLDLDFVVLEHVHGRGSDGGAGAFVFGEAAGALRMAIVAAGIPYRLAPPAAWKTKLKCPSDKVAARSFASQVFPAAANQWPRVKDDGRAEAALLAHYGASFLK